MPSDDDLRTLAGFYLTKQRELWPDLVESGDLPQVTDDSIGAMVTAFKGRFLNDRPIVESGDLAKCTCAATYLRYSDEGSNARSNLQQLDLILARARRDNRFIPWALVFADSAITGTIANRRGYELAKEAIADPDLAVAGLYLDDIGRGNRDIIETMTLGQMIWALNKRLIGVSDGFDSDMPLAKLILAIFGFFQEWFIEQLRSKVNRGMKDAFLNGTNTGLPAPGFKLVPRDKESRDGEKRVMVLAIHEDEARVIRTVFALYAERLWSPDRIAKLLNRRRFRDSTSWDGGRVRSLLRNRRYLGIMLYRTTHQVLHKATGKITTVERDRKDWLVRRDRHLKIISYKLWKKTKQRLEKLGVAWKKQREGSNQDGCGRAELYAKTLFRPKCGKCKATMTLGGTGRHPYFNCPNGKYGKNGCDCKGYKSVQKFEKSMLDVLLKDVVNEQRAMELTVAATQFFGQLSQEPKVDASPIKSEIRAFQSKIKRLIRLVADDDENSQNLSEVRKEIEKHQKQVSELNKRLQEVDVHNAPPPAPPTESYVRTCMQDLRRVLHGDVGRAAEILRKLTGPICVTQEKAENQRGYTWTARFSANLIAAFATIEAGKDTRKSGVWEYLNNRVPIVPFEVAIQVKDAPKYEELAPIVAELLARNASKLSIASYLKISAQYVDLCQVFHQTGERPTWPKKNRRRRKPAASEPALPPYRKVASDVKRLKDQRDWSWREIGEMIFEIHDIRLHESTLRRAYDFASPERVEEAIKSGKPANRSA